MRRDGGVLPDERGELGRDFWRRGVAPMLREAELSLARHCAFELGADEYITKPFDLAELSIRIKQLLSRRTPGG